MLKQAADASGRQYDRSRGKCPAGGNIVHGLRDDAVADIAPDQPVDHVLIFQNRDVPTFAHAVDQRLRDLLTGLVRVVQDTVDRM